MTHEEAKQIALTETNIAREDILEITVTNFQNKKRKKAGLLVAIQLNIQMDPDTIFVEIYEDPLEINVPDVI